MKPEIEEIKKIKEWWEKVDPGCDDPEDVANKATDDVPILLSALEAAQEEVAEAKKALGDMAANKSSLADGIRNLQQAYITERGNVETLEREAAAQREENKGLSEKVNDLSTKLFLEEQAHMSDRIELEKRVALSRTEKEGG